MSELNELINDTSDAAKSALKSELIDLIYSAKSESADVIRETAEKIEKWTTMKLRGEIDAEELKELIESRRGTVQQFLNTQEINLRARLEKVSIGLMDLITEKALGVIV